MINTLIHSFGVPILNGFMTGSFKLEFLLSLVIGLNVGIPITYYFLNGRSFSDTSFANGIVISFFGLIPAGILAFLVVYLWNL